MDIIEQIDRFKANETKVDTFVNTNSDYITDTGQAVESLPHFMARMIATYAAVVPRGNWATGTAYAVKDLSVSGGLVYICLAAHTSGTFATDLAAAKWALYQGVTSAALSASGGAAMVGTSGSRTQDAVNKDFVNLLDYSGGLAPDCNGGTGNGVDWSPIFAAAIAVCAASGKSLVVPGATLGYRFASQVNFRNIHVQAENAKFYLDFSGIGHLAGGDSNSGMFTPIQRFGWIYRIGETWGTYTNPCLRITGSKDQWIWVNAANWLQVWAGTYSGDTTQRSTAYSTIWLGRAGKFSIESDPDAGEEGWANENIVYLNRCNDLALKGTAALGVGHNHIYHGCFEATAGDNPICTIEIDYGYYNTLHDIRVERNAGLSGTTHVITMGANALGNRICISRPSGSGFGSFPSGLPENVQVNDNSVVGGNLIYSSQEQSMDRTNVLRASTSDAVFNNIDPSIPTYDRYPSLQKIKGNFYQKLAQSKPLELVVGDWYSFHWNGSESRYRPMVEFFDEMGRALAASASWVYSSALTAVTTPYGGSIANACTTTVGSPTNVDFQLTKVAYDGGARRIVVSVRNSNSGVDQLNTATEIDVCRESHMRPSSNYGADDVAEFLFSAVPTKGFSGRVGRLGVTADLSKIIYNKFSLDTRSTATAASGGTTITVDVVTGILSGDIIGICTDDGETHWSTVSGAPSGSVVTFANALPYAASSFNRVVFNRIKYQSVTLV